MNQSLWNYSALVGFEGYNRWQRIQANLFCFGLPKQF